MPLLTNTSVFFTGDIVVGWFRFAFLQCVCFSHLQIHQNPVGQMKMFSGMMCLRVCMQEEKALMIKFES